MTELLLRQTEKFRRFPTIYCATQQPYAIFELIKKVRLT